MWFNLGKAGEEKRGGGEGGGEGGEEGREEGREEKAKEKVLRFASLVEFDCYI